MHASTAALSSTRDCGANTAAASTGAVVLVEVEVCALVDMVTGAFVLRNILVAADTMYTMCALVDMHSFDIEPDDPTNISSLLACEWTHAAPQSARTNDVAP